MDVGFFAPTAVVFIAHDKDNDTLHAQYADKNMDFQALRGGIVEFNSNKEINGHFVVFYKQEIKNIFINDKQIKTSLSTYDKFSKITTITTILNDYDIIKFNSKKFILDIKNAAKIQYYKFTPIQEILNISQDYISISKEHFNIIKNVGKNAIQLIFIRMAVILFRWQIQSYIQRNLS